MLDGSSVGFMGIGMARKKGVFGVNLGSVYFIEIGTRSICKSGEFFYLDFYSRNLIYHTLLNLIEFAVLTLNAIASVIFLGIH